MIFYLTPVTQHRQQTTRPGPSKCYLHPPASLWLVLRNWYLQNGGSPNCMKCPKTKLNMQTHREFSANLTTTDRPPGTKAESQMNLSLLLPTVCDKI